MAVMLEQHMNGFIITILLIKLVHLIKHLAMIMVLDVQLKLNAEIASLKKDVGLKKELKSMGLANSEMLSVKPT
jgi:hypothetical protein